MLFMTTLVNSANLANPTITLPEARVAVGASYHLGGYTLYNLEVPSLFNRIHGRVEYGPFKYLTLGIDLGTTKIDVDTDSLFQGKFGFSGGGHLKIATPRFAKQYLSVIVIGQATIFNSVNSHSPAYAGKAYAGKDGTGALGLQVHIPGFGYITAGPWVYLIQGTNTSYTGQEAFYSNTDNIRGWLAIDFFPKMKEIGNNKPYISLEVSISPKATYSERIPVQAFSVSISVGSVTGRLYGTESDVEWNP
jgi:hypothetical protein